VSAELLPPLPRSDGADDRRLCSECRHMRGRQCSIARPGGVVSARKVYEPAETGLLQRCKGFENA